MKTKLGLPLLLLLIAVGCDDSTESEQATEPVPVAHNRLLKLVGGGPNQTQWASECRDYERLVSHSGHLFPHTR
jgi:hypothetical protein